MRLAIDATLAAEAQSCQLRWSCQDCVHQLEGPPPGCEHGWPAAEHQAKPLTVGGEVVFCKEFELG